MTGSAGGKPMNLRSCFSVVLILAIAGGAQAARIDDDLRSAERLAWQKRFAEAERQYREVLRRDPKSRAAALGLGQVLLWEQRYDVAAAVYRGLLRDAPDDVDARKGLATAEYWSGDFRGARRDYAIVLRARPGDVESRKALADITAASAPLLASDNDFMSDDQPLHRARMSVAYTAFSDPLTKWTATSGAYALSARGFGSATSPFVALAGSTFLPAAHLRASGSLRLFRFPDGETKPLGGFALAREWRGATISFDVEQHELLYTASALRTHASETTTTLDWTRSSDAASSSVALHAIRYFDGNSGRAADAYHLARVAHGASGSLSIGAAVSYRDTEESRLVFVGSERRYDPYWTPLDLSEVRAVAAATLNAGRAAVRLHADGGWARDRDGGVHRTFYPWRVSADFVFPLRGAFTATIGVEHQTTVFYNANSIRLGVSGRL
jgi:tetratricopeptide (TPR) repeat protein